MKVEQRADGRYIKTPDKVDQYLLRVVQRFMEEEKEDNPATREAIIEEAARRARNDNIVAMKNIVVEESRRFAQEEMKGIIELHLADIVEELKAKLEEMKAQQIQQRRFKIVIDEPTVEIFIPETIKIHSTKDIITINYNGIEHDDVDFVVTAQGFISSINFKEMVLMPEDVVTIKALVVNA